MFIIDTIYIMSSFLYLPVPIKNVLQIKALGYTTYTKLLHSYDYKVRSSTDICDGHLLDINRSCALEFHSYGIHFKYLICFTINLI